MPNQPISSTPNQSTLSTLLGPSTNEALKQPILSEQPRLPKYEASNQPISLVSSELPTYEAPNQLTLLASNQPISLVLSGPPIHEVPNQPKQSAQLGLLALF